MRLPAFLRRIGPPATAAADGPRVVSAARSHVGRVRSINEDRLLNRADAALWAVADGMGGHAAGDVAATITIAAVRALADTGSPFTGDDVRTALDAANGRIRAGRVGRERISGATVVVAALDGDRAVISWAGDSRAYRWRAGRLDAISRDHSVVQELIDAGALPPDRAHAHPKAHVVTRALGCAEAVAIDSVSADVAPGDRLLLCSDGLTGPVPETTIARLVGAGAPAAACDALVDAALAAGGPDNVSVVVVAIG